MESTVLLGIVAIGRNEGDRLERCLRAAKRADVPLVYVDSDSSDESAARARSLGVEVVELDPALPMSAARARNAGVSKLLERWPKLEVVQFIDGDCELVDGWLELASNHLSEDEGLGAVCGRRRERSVSASPYNRLIDLEWDTPVGRAAAFGGDVLLRAAVFRAVDGYDETLIAGEDPDLAARIGDAGWGIERIDAEMTIHDADLNQFGQWWTRQVRAGHAAAEAWLRESGATDRNRRRVASIAFWGAGLPLCLLFGLWLGASTAALSLLLLAYPALGFRIYRSERRRGRSPAHAILYSASCIEGKFAETVGLARCLLDRARGQRAELIEYK